MVVRERETERERENERVTVAERSSILCDPRLELARNIIYGRFWKISSFVIIEIR